MKYLVYGHSNIGKPVVIEVDAENGSEALNKVRKIYSRWRFNHANIA